MILKQFNGKFYGKSIISVDQFDTKSIEIVFKLAREYKKGIESEKIYTDLQGKLLTALFYEPSSRTFSSHIAAMQQLGGTVIPIHGTANSSVSKGETLEDTIRVFSSYSDIIVLRHPEKGAAILADSVASVPIINAGDGVGEHPTQALLDLFTIHERLGKLNSISVAMVGDLKYGRTVHSLSKLLSLYSNMSIYLVCPRSSPMPKSIVSLISKRGVTIKYTDSVNDILSKVDVLYMTRVQKERMDKKLYESIKDLYLLTNKMAQKMKSSAIIMHPLPRIHEITKDVDDNPRSVYFTDQMRNGMYVRMVLLKLILTKSKI